MAEEKSKAKKQLRRLRATITGRNVPSLSTIAMLMGAVLAVSLVFWLSAHVIGLDGNGILNRTFRAVGDSPWSLPIVALCFTAASLIGAPQFLLIAVTVAVFGPVKGFFFSVLSTLVSASVNFMMARYLGAEWLRRRGWTGVESLSQMVSRNGFLAALLVRIIPSAPFIVVNIGLGLTQMSYAAFIAGTGVGILPKTALIALLGKVVERAQSGDLGAMGYLLLAAACWIALAFVAKWLVLRRENSNERAEGSPRP